MGDVTTTNPAHRDRRLCSALNRTGDPCGAYALISSDRCFYHDPDAQAERAAARSKGGRRRHGRDIGETGAADPVRLETVRDAVEILADAVRDALRLENSIARARTIGYLASQAIAALKVADLERRIIEMEEALANEH